MYVPLCFLLLLSKAVFRHSTVVSVAGGVKVSVVCVFTYTQWCLCFEPTFQSRVIVSVADGAKMASVCVGNYMYISMWLTSIYGSVHGVYGRQG